MYTSLCYVNHPADTFNEFIVNYGSFGFDDI